MNEEKEYLTLDEAAELLGIKRATFWNYMDDLGIESHKFGRDRRRYLSREEVNRLKEYKESPWKFKVKTRDKKNEQAA